MSPLDLHVLGTPPAFVLSQDQTLPFNPFNIFRCFTLWNLRCLLPVLRVLLCIVFKVRSAPLIAFALRRAWLEYQIIPRLSSTFFPDFHFFIELFGLSPVLFCDYSRLRCVFC